MPQPVLTLADLRTDFRVKRIIRDGGPPEMYPDLLRAAARSLILAGYSNDEILGVLMDPQHAISAPGYSRQQALGVIERQRERYDAYRARQDPPLGDVEEKVLMWMASREVTRITSREAVTARLAKTAKEALGLFRRMEKHGLGRVVPHQGRRGPKSWAFQVGEGVR